MFLSLLLLAGCDVELALDLTEADLDTANASSEGSWVVRAIPGLSGRAPVASPDGRLVAFTAPDRSIGIANRDGTGSIAITPFPLAFLSSTFSPDSTRVAFREGDDGVWVSPVDGSAAPVHVNGSTYEVATGPSWSPDGARIAFSAILSGCTPGTCHQRVLLADAGGGAEPTRVNRFEDVALYPTFTPDGSDVVMVGPGEPWKRGLWLARADGSGEVRVYDGETYSADGPLTFTDAGGSGSVYFSGSSEAVCDPDSCENDTEILSMESEGALTNLTNTPEVDEYGGIVSPDGRYVVFQSYPGGGVEVVDTETLDRTLVVAAPLNALAQNQQAWLPDSSGFLFSDGDVIYEARLE